jgi:hypothetical protein
MHNFKSIQYKKKTETTQLDFRSSNLKLDNRKKIVSVNFTFLIGG